MSKPGLGFASAWALALAACGGGRTAAPSIETNYITEMAAIPVEVIHQYHVNLERARELARYDRLAWIATDSINPFTTSVGARHFQGYVVTFQQDSATVSFGDTGDGKGYVKYCEVGFSARGAHPIRFDKPRIGTGTEIRLYHALQAARRELPKGEYEQGRHNFYMLEARDTVSVYLVPGYRDGQFIFGGSYLYRFVDGRLVSRQAFHLGYQYVKLEKKMGEVEIASTLNTVPNECDLMKFLVYRDFMPKLRIRTSRYRFFLWEKPDDQVGFDLRVLPAAGS
jgi:hypothetical protein